MPPSPRVAVSGPAQLSESAVTEAFAASDASSEVLTFFWLDQFSQRLPLSRPEAVTRRAQELSRQSRRFAASTAMNADARERLVHLAEVGAAAMQLCAAALAHDGHGVGDDRAMSATSQALSTLVFEDGAVDGAEQAVLHSAVRVVFMEPPPAGAPSFLWMFAAGHRLPASDTEAMTLTGDLLGPSPLKLWRNRGITRILKPGYPPAGYRWLASNDPLVQGRNASKECFTFALSTDAKWELAEGVLPDEWLRDHYRPIDLTSEKARPGDLIAYYPLIWSLDPAKRDVIAGEIEHMAVVSRVDAKGRPLRAVSKIGWRMGVFEHPVDEVPFSVGVGWTVYRRKT